MSALIWSQAAVTNKNLYVQCALVLDETLEIYTAKPTMLNQSWISGTQVVNLLYKLCLI